MRQAPGEAGISRRKVILEGGRLSRPLAGGEDGGGRQRYTGEATLDHRRDQGA